MVTRKQIDSRRHMMPGRVPVVLHIRQKRDVWNVTQGILCERRPSSQRERSGDSAGQSGAFDYVFWRVELDASGVVVSVGDVIEDTDAYPGQRYVSVDSIRVELQGRRIRAICTVSANPQASI